MGRIADALAMARTPEKVAVRASLLATQTDSSPNLRLLVWPWGLQLVAQLASCERVRSGVPMPSSAGYDAPAQRTWLGLWSP